MKNVGLTKAFEFLPCAEKKERWINNFDLFQYFVFEKNKTGTRTAVSGTIGRVGTVGEICVVPDLRGKALISTNLIRIFLNLNLINSKYFVYLFQGGGIVKEQVKELCKGSTRNFLNQTILNSIIFPILSLVEQEYIVQKIESRLSVADKLEETIELSLQQAEALRQSILKRAFEGKLVPQYPNDEPAEKLLERIKAARH